MEGSREGLLADFTTEERFLFKKALSRLSAHDDTPRRLCERLAKLTYRKEPVSREACVKVVRFLHAQGLINEKAYADDLVRALKSRGYGARRIEGELYRRKFSESTRARVREALRAEEEDESSRAFVMLSRRAAARHSDLSDPQEKGRLYGYLSRLGFDSETCKSALKQLEEREEES